MEKRLDGGREVVRLAAEWKMKRHGRAAQIWPETAAVLAGTSVREREGERRCAKVLCFSGCFDRNKG